MARNTRASKGMKKIEPSVMTIALVTPTTQPGTSEDSYLDLSQITSILNRRFMRQGLNWAVAGFKFGTPTPATGVIRGEIGVSKLPNTWVCSNAWEKSFRMWNKQQREALETAGSESAAARFRDFKVHMDTDHVTAGFASNLLPQDSDQNIALPGEWESSQIVVPNTVADASGSTVLPYEYKLHVVGANNFAGQSRGIIDGYAQSRAYPQSPDPAAPVVSNDDNWFKQMFDVGNDDTEVLQNATDKNDDLPYDQVQYPGSFGNLPGLQIHDTVRVSGTTIGGTSFAKGGNFPCGLIKITHFCDVGSEAHPLSLLIDLVPGHHRGYMAEPMTEM